MKRKFKAGSTSQTIEVFIRDSSSSVGAGLAGLVFNTGSLTCYYHRQGAATAVAVTLATATVGTWASGGFIAVDGTNMPGHYELGIPDAALASGARYVTLLLKGAANMAPVPIEIELDAVDYQDAAGFGLSRLDAAVSSRSTYAGGDTSGTTTLLARLTSTRADVLDELLVGGDLESSISATAAAVGSITTNTTLIKAKTDNLPASPAAVGSAMTLATAAITAATFQDASITADTFAEGAIGAAELDQDAIDAIAAAILATPANLLATDASGQVTAGSLGPNAITAASLAADAGTEIAAAVWAVLGWGTWTMKQTIRAIAQILQGKRANVPAAGAAGSVTFEDNAAVNYGSVTVDTAGNITTSAMTPPA